MSFLRDLSNIFSPKRYPSAWARQQTEREDRWRKIRSDLLEEEYRKFANRRRTTAV
jgi:hypothetical protein